MRLENAAILGHIASRWRCRSEKYFVDAVIGTGRHRCAAGSSGHGQFGDELETTEDRCSKPQIHRFAVASKRALRQNADEDQTIAM